MVSCQCPDYGDSGYVGYIVNIVTIAPRRHLGLPTHQKDTYERKQAITIRLMTNDDCGLTFPNNVPAPDRIQDPGLRDEIIFPTDLWLPDPLPRC